MKNSRREFLKVAGLSAFALGSASALNLVADANAATAKGMKPDVVGSYEVSPKELTAKRWAMVIDTRRFTTGKDFEKVIQACHTEHNVPDIPNKLQEVKWLWKDSFAHTFPDESHDLLPISFTEGRFLLLCNHCENPPCTRVCPTGATFRQEDGIVVMDPHRCIGCRFCMAGCPYGSRSFNFRDPKPFIANEDPRYPSRTRGVVEKCTFCPERLAQGKMPACVEASEGAILFGDLTDPKSSVRRALADHYSIRRKSSLGTGPGVYYII